jgi:hypothetical protein
MLTTEDWEEWAEGLLDNPSFVSWLACAVEDGEIHPNDLSDEEWEAIEHLVAFE